MKLIDSLSYSPVELGFGTSGLRALVTEMTDLECYINTLGFIQFLKKECGVKNGDEIYLAGDLRDSTPRIMQAVYQAIIDAKCQVKNYGLIPTPALAYQGAIKQKACVMITGSHIPADRNGIKFYKPEGEVLKHDETDIQKHVAEVRAETYAQGIEEAIFDPQGDLKKSIKLSAADHKGAAEYISRYTEVFSGSPLLGKHIIVYQHSAVGRDILVNILEELGAKVTAVGRTDTFVPIDSENVTPTDKQLFLEYAEDYPDNFAIVSTDGDSDRPFVVDETGQFHRGDVLGLVASEFLGADFAAVPISSNDAVNTFCRKQDIALVHTKIGSPYIVEAMANASKTCQKKCGWEVNGGYLTSNDIEINGNKLRALPTRDAVLPILCALMLAVQKDVKVSKIFGDLPKRYTGGGLIDNIPLEKIARFKDVCKSIEKIKSLMNKAFNGSDLGEPKNVDLTDGLRLVFAGSKIVHLRPSGNAPQFRVYTNASSQSEADTLAAKAISSDGYIQRILAEL